MRKAYNEIMEKVQVDDEMRRRVLRHLSQKMDADAAKMVIRRRWQRGASLAACVAVLLMGGLLLRQRNAAPEDTPPVAAQFGIEEVGSAEALADKAAFPIRDVGPLPFEPVSVSYSWCWGELAQIRYEGENGSVLYRKSRGSEDISGDYQLYSQQQNLDIDGIAVTLKGDGGLVCLATWQTDGFTCSLSADPGLAEQDFRALLESALYGA